MRAARCRHASSFARLHDPLPPVLEGCKPCCGRHCLLTRWSGLCTSLPWQGLNSLAVQSVQSLVSELVLVAYVGRTS